MTFHGRRPKRRWSIAALLALSVAVYGLLVRPRILRWGASDEEIEQPYPGVDVIPGGERGSTMAVTIDAPPLRVWPWLVQMGCDRAGWYSWDRLDNGGVPSAQQIHPEWQDITIGTHLASTPSAKTWFEVAAIDPGHFLGLRAPIDLRTWRPFDTSGPRPQFYSDGLWGFQLMELPGGRTRLVVSGYGAARPWLLQKIAELPFWEPAHRIMQTRQFANLKRRVERQSAGGHAHSSPAR